MTNQAGLSSSFDSSLSDSPPLGKLPSPINSQATSPGAIPERLTSLQRLTLVVMIVGILAGFILAGMLTPDPRGLGTHQQLGLPPCTIQFLYGIPCPSCGMTTSFSWFVRGNLIQSAQANLAGLMLAMICLIMIPWSILSLWTNRLYGISDWKLNTIIIMGCWILVSLVQWAVRLCV